MRFLCIQCNVLAGHYKWGKTAKNLFCSNQCHHDYIWAKRKEQIAKESLIRNAREGRKYLLETYGHICTICKITMWCWKPVPLVCDHIDGNSDNWELNNLRMICCNCDAQTSTYKNKNKGKGRHSRMKRYKTGKSY